MRTITTEHCCNVNEPSKIALLLLLTCCCCELEHSIVIPLDYYYE